MTMKMKLLFLVILSLLFVATQGLRFSRYPTRKSWTRKPWRPTSRPTFPTAIPRENCREFMDEVPKSPSKNEFELRPVCMRLNETKLLDKLKDVGGYNPRYMALNSSDACNFVDLTNDEQPQPTTLPPPTQTPTRSSKYIQYNKGRQDETEEDDTLTRKKRMVPSQPGTVLRGCWSAGSFFGNSDFKRTCTECPATTQLASNVFPPLINEVVCHDRQRSCLPVIGQCFQRVLKFTFLRTTGRFVRDDFLSRVFGVTVYVEEWQRFTQDIRSCCDCRASS